MTKPQNLTIMCYLAWCGAEVKHRFANEKDYETARAFLSEIARLHFTSNELRPSLSREVTDYYFIEEQQRDAFGGFMQKLSQGRRHS